MPDEDTGNELPRFLIKRGGGGRMMALSRDGYILQLADESLPFAGEDRLVDGHAETRRGFRIGFAQADPHSDRFVVDPDVFVTAQPEEVAKFLRQHDRAKALRIKKLRAHQRENADHVRWFLVLEERGVRHAWRAGQRYRIGFGRYKEVETGRLYLGLVTDPQGAYDPEGEYVLLQTSEPGEFVAQGDEAAWTQPSAPASS